MPTRVLVSLDYSHAKHAIYHEQLFKQHLIPPVVILQLYLVFETKK